MGRGKSYNKKLVKQIAGKRMIFLFEKAHEIFPKNKDLANRYVELAKKYAQRARLTIPSNWKKRICHNCKNFLYPGINARTRMNSNKKGSHVSLTCLDCNHITRYYIKTGSESN